MSPFLTILATHIYRDEIRISFTHVKKQSYLPTGAQTLVNGTDKDAKVRRPTLGVRKGNRCAGTKGLHILNRRTTDLVRVPQ